MTDDPMQTETLEVTIPVRLREQIDAWRMLQRPLVDEQTAIEMLLRLALEHKPR